MKRLPTIILFIVSLLLSATGASAQWTYGFNLGASFPKVSTGDDPGLFVENHSGFRGGLTVEYELPRCGVAFDASVLYMRVSYNLFDNRSTEIDPARDYLEIPLFIKYKWWLGAAKKLVAPMVMTGPSLMVRLSGDSPYVTTHRALPAWNVGLGVDVARHLQLSAGYRFALTDATRSYEGIPEPTLHLSGWWLSAMLLFDF